MTCPSRTNQLATCAKDLSKCVNTKGINSSDNKQLLEQISKLNEKNNYLKSSIDNCTKNNDNLKFQLSKNSNNSSDTSSYSTSDIYKYGIITGNNFYKTEKNTEMFTNFDNKILTFSDIENQNNHLLKSINKLNDKYSTTTYNQSVKYESIEETNLKKLNLYLLYIYYFFFIIILINFVLKKIFNNKQKIFILVLLFIFPFIIFYIEYGIYFLINYIYSILSGNIFYF
jgi:hypothetical protein